MRQKILLTVAILVGIYFTVSLSRQVWNLWQAGSRLELAKEKVASAENENQKLKEELKYKSSSEFVESEARNRLNYAREGEQIVILPQELNNPQGEAPAEQKLANWQKWWRLLFEV